MTIYVSHSKNFDYRKELYQPIRQADIFRKHRFVFPHLTSEKPYPTKELFESGKCDLVLAEVSFASTGQGIEVGWANFLKIPILCFYRKGSCPSQSLKTVSDNLIEYTDSRDLVPKLTIFLEKLENAKA